MPPYLSPLFRLRLSALGEDLSTWGDPNLNNALKLIEEAVAGPITLTITGDRTLTSDNYISNEYRHGHHYLIGSPAADFTITIPPVAFPYRFVNRTGRQATIKTAAGTGAVVRVGMITAVLCDGTNCTALDPTLDKIQAPAANVAMAGFKLTGLADGTATGDAIHFGQITTLIQPYVSLASDWAQKTSGEVVSSSFTAYSARLWATSSTLLGSTGYKGAFGYAQDASTSATNAFNSATLANNWATTTGSKVDGNEYAAKEYAVGTTVAAGSAKTWATSTTVVAGGLKGAQGYAQDAGTSASNASASATLAQSWATSTTTVSGGFKGAYGYAQDAAASASAAATSAASAAGVTTFNGRSGAVVPTANDYSFSQLSGTASATQLPNPTTTAKGGVQANAGSANQWVTGISTSTGALTFAQPDFSNLSGTATYTQITSGALATTGAAYWANTASMLATPTGLWASQAFITITYAASVAPDLNTFLNATITLTGNLTLANPTNAKAGQSGFIRLVQDGTGSRTLALGTAWKFAGGPPTLSTAASSVDAISYVVVDAVTPVINCAFLKAIA